MIRKLQEKLGNQFEGKRVSILASGPSLELFLKNEKESRSEGIIIGVNGANKLLEKGDIFISGEEGTHLEDWFYSCPEGVRNIVRACSALYTERFYPNERKRKNLINRFKKFLSTNREYVRIRWDGVQEIVPEELQNSFDLTLPDPAEPHLLLHQVKNIGKRIKINSQQNYLIIGGTVTCVATQIAYHLGAKEIHLYGASFTNESSMENSPGQNYFHMLNSSGGGYTTSTQRKIFGEIIRQIHQEKTRIFSHGFSRLENTIKLKE